MFSSAFEVSASELPRLDDNSYPFSAEVTEPRGDLIKGLIEKFYLPVLKNKVFHVAAIVTFIGLFTIGVLGCFELHIGLNQ